MQGRALSAVVHAVFIASGVSALIYQLVWQRSLMLIYGTNSESVAMVVSAFLAGLGLGTLAGGALSRLPKAPLVLCFSGFELIIGLYGLGSLRLFQWVSGHTLQAGVVETGIWAFALVLIPTLLMGATLPVLVAHCVRATGHVGRSVSGLYFVNTLGAGLGAFAAAFVLLRRFGLSGSVEIAAVLNLASAAAILAASAAYRRRP